jgi:nicotinate-nucleotide pyrophosphorylase (carboxylating)
MARSRSAGRVKLEASGGVTLDNVRRIAETGVDIISVGAITHSAPMLDLSMEFEGINTTADPASPRSARS